VAETEDEWTQFLREEAKLRSEAPAKAEYGDSPAGKVAQKAVPASAALGQGFSLGFSDELGAAIDTGISKVPGLRTVAEGINSIGGHPGLSPLTDPSLTYEQRRDEYRRRNAGLYNEAPKTFAAGQVVGAIAASPVIGPGAGASIPTRVGVSALEGAAAGVGANERPEDMLKDTGRGLGIGAGAGVLGAVIQKGIAGAPARNTARDLNRLGVTKSVAGPSRVVDGAIESSADDIKALLGHEKAIRAAARAGNPQGVVAANAAAMAPKTAETQAIYQAANVRGGGGLDPVAVRKALNDTIDNAVKNGAHPSYIRRVKTAIDQVEALEVGIPWQTAAGSGVSRVIPADKLRTFITEKLPPTGREKQVGTTAEAVRDAALALKDQLYKFAGKDAEKLKALDKDVSTHLLIEQAALNAADKARYALPKPPEPLKSAARAVGETFDRVAGATVGKSPNFMRRVPAAALESGTRRAAVQGIVDKLSANDTEGAKNDLVNEVYGP
jgi:hypothetical protein